MVEETPEVSAAELPREVQAGPDDAGQRLDRFLCGRLAPLSRARVQALMRQGAIHCDGVPALDPGAKVRAGHNFTIDIPAPVAAHPKPEAIPLTVVFEDRHLIVIDKPPGLVVHPGAGQEGGTLVNALIAHCGESLSGIGGVRRPGIVHRLDKDTSGLLVVAKSDAAHQGLAAQFASHGADGRLERRYLALVWGRPDRPQGSVDAALARSTANRTKIAVTASGRGRHAVTHFTVREAFADAERKPLASLLELRLETGRTHQIRVHLAHIGHPVMGDATYGAGFKTSISRLGEPSADALQRLGRQALHAAALGFEHPVTRRALAFESPLPADISAVLAALRADLAGRRVPAPRQRR